MNPLAKRATRKTRDRNVADTPSFTALIVTLRTFLAFGAVFLLFVATDLETALGSESGKKLVVIPLQLLQQHHSQNGQSISGLDL